jgi:hypothetical protein
MPLSWSQNRNCVVWRVLMVKYMIDLIKFARKQLSISILHYQVDSLTRWNSPHFDEWFSRLLVSIVMVKSRTTKSAKLVINNFLLFKALEILRWAKTIVKMMIFRSPLFELLTKCLKFKWQKTRLIYLRVCIEAANRCGFVLLTLLCFMHM